MTSFLRNQHDRRARSAFATLICVVIRVVPFVLEVLHELLGPLVAARLIRQPGHQPGSSTHGIVVPADHLRRAIQIGGDRCHGLHAIRVGDPSSGSGG